MVGGHRNHQGRLADLQDADPVAGRDGAHPGGPRGYLAHHPGKDLCGRRVRRIFQPHYPASAVVVADHAVKADDGAGRFMAHQVLVLGEGDRLVGQGGPQDQCHRWWSSPANCSSAWSSTSAEHRQGRRAPRRVNPAG